MQNDKHEADRDFAERLTAAASVGETLIAIEARLTAIERAIATITEKGTVRSQAELPEKSEISKTFGPQKILFGLSEAAEILSLHPATVRALINQGYLPMRKIGRLVRIQRKDLENLAKFDIPSVWGNEKPWPKERGVQLERRPSKHKR